MTDEEFKKEIYYSIFDKDNPEQSVIECMEVYYKDRVKWDKELKDILKCLIRYTSDGDTTQDAMYLEVIQTDLTMYFKKNGILNYIIDKK